MKLLDDYTFDEHLRYEAHQLFYSPTDNEPVVLSGILAAGIMGALLSVTDEGEARGIVLDTPEGRKDFFRRYEKEVLGDNGGLLTTEVQALKDSYIEFTGEEELLQQICRNERLLNLAIELMVEYMQGLVREEIGEQIYDKVPWTGPFAQWLYNAGFVETRRQYLLSINWTDAAAVFALAEGLSNLQSQTSNNQSPTFVFDGLSAQQVLNSYWDWLWDTVQKEANLYPDAKVRLAEYKQYILANETNHDFLKPEMKHFTPAQLNLFENWMSQWVAFVEDKIPPAPNTTKRNDRRQEIFMDNIMPIPPERNYVEVVNYIKERCRYDKNFEKYFRSYKRTDFCFQLSLLFRWNVDPNSLGKRLRKKAKK